MKAIHKYQKAAQQGNREAQRRIAQSMGYKHTVYDMPKLITLLYKAGIELPGVDYSSADNIVDDTGIQKDFAAESKTISL